MTSGTRSAQGSLALIDASEGQAGWQFTRSAMTLAAVTSTPIRIINILTHRPSRGLRPIHIPTLKAIAAVCGQEDFELSPGATELEFVPGPVEPGNFTFDAGPAGSASVLLQSVAIPLAFAFGSSTVEVVGMTHGPRMPTYEYLTYVWVKLLRKIGIELEIKMPQVGFSSRDEGRLIGQIGGFSDPSDLRPFCATHRGAMGKSICWSKVAAGLPIKVGEHQRVLLQRALNKGDIDPPIQTEMLQSRSPGTVCFVGMDFESGPAGFSSIGGPGKSGEVVAEEVADQAIRFLDDEHQAALDPYAPDQILIPLALAKEASRFTTTALTSATLQTGNLISKLLDRSFAAQGRLMQFGTIELS